MLQIVEVIAVKYPKLVHSWVQKTPISLAIEGEGLTEDGAPAEGATYEGFCNWQDGGKVVYTANNKVVEISGRAYFDGDIVPTISNIVGGTAVIFEETREILQGFKRRNPDGTVNNTEEQFT